MIRFRSFFHFEFTTPCSLHGYSQKLRMHPFYYRIDHVRPGKGGYRKPFYGRNDARKFADKHGEENGINLALRFDTFFPY